MSVYITVAEFDARFSELERIQLTQNDATIFDRAAADASSLVNGYLAARYSLPLATVPAMVGGWTGDIARFRLWDDQAPEEVRRRYEDAIKQLEALARGLIVLPPGADGTSNATSVEFDGFCDDRVFTSASLAGYCPP